MHAGDGTISYQFQGNQETASQLSEVEETIFRIAVVRSHNLIVYGIK